MFQTTSEVENFLAIHMRHFIEPWNENCDACTDDVNQIIEEKLGLVSDSQLIEQLWMFCQELIDSDYDAVEDVIWWMLPIATHRLATQETFDQYLRQIYLEWQLIFDYWPDDAWDDMRKQLSLILASPRFVKSGVSIQDIVSRIHVGHQRFGFCDGFPEDCVKCQAVAAEFVS